MGANVDEPLGYLLKRAMSLLEPRVTAGLRPLGLRLPQFVCMKILSASPGRSSAELARLTNVSPQAMDQLLRAMEDSGVVSRPAVVASGRARPAELTETGRALLARAEAAVALADAEILHRLTGTQQRQLKSMLDVIGTPQQGSPPQ